MSSIGLRSRGAAYAPGAIAYSIGRHRRRVLVLLLASAMMTPAFGKGSSTPPGHRHAPAHGGASSEGKHHGHGSAHKGERSEQAAKSRILPDRESAQESAAALEPSTDLTATKQAIALLRHRKSSEALALAATIDDPVARKLVEWIMLRDSDSPAGFDRYAAFIQANADWPSIASLRRRAEARLWQERRDASTVRRFLGRQPVSAVGRLALARVLQGEGDRAGAEREVRGVWQSAEMSAELETAVSNEFAGVLTSRRRCRAHGQAYRRQRLRRGDARRQTAWSGSRRNRQGLRGRRGEFQEGQGSCLARSPKSYGEIWVMCCAAFTGCKFTTTS